MTSGRGDINSVVMKTIKKLNHFNFSKALTFFVVIIASIAMVDCAGDKDFNSFRDDLANQKQAQSSAVNGTYAGLGASKLDNSTLGLFQVQTVASSELQNSSDQLGTEKKSVMKGQLTYTGLTNATVTFSQGLYSPETNEFFATVPVVDEAGLTQNIKIAGKIQSGAFVGSIYLDQYPSYGVNVNLGINSNLSQASVDAKSVRALQLASDNLSYQGNLNLNGATLLVTMKINSPSSNSQQQFLRVLNPQRTVLVTFNFQDEMSKLNSGMVFSGNMNDQVGSLTGLSTVSGGSSPTPFSINMNCKKQLVKGAQAWNCTITQGIKSFSVLLLSVAPTAIK